MPPGRNDSLQIPGYQRQVTERLAFAKVELPAPVNRYRPHTVTPPTKAARVHLLGAAIGSMPTKVQGMQIWWFCWVCRLR